MIRYSPNADRFKLQLSESLKRETTTSNPVKIPKNGNVYTCGDDCEYVYLIEKGQVKLTMLSSAGKECILTIYTAGDVFGELCLSDLYRRETATAMTNVVLKRIRRSRFLLRLTADSLLEGFVKYLATRISDQQETINDLVTADSEQRLAKTLLQLAGKTVMKDTRSVRLAYRITHEELSAMVGTTRPRISHFMVKFRELGLIALGEDRVITVRERKLNDYLERSA